MQTLMERVLGEDVTTYERLLYAAGVLLRYWREFVRRRRLERDVLAGVRSAG